MKMVSRLLIAGVAGLFLLPQVVSALVLAPPESSELFSDVSPYEGYHDAIYWMKENRVIQGYPNGTFQPDRCVNRVEILKMAFEAAQADLETAVSASTLYSDISFSQWYWPYLFTASQRGIVEGYPDGTYKPNECVSRAEAVKIVGQFFPLLQQEIPRGGGAGTGRNALDNFEYAWFHDRVSVALDRDLLGLDHVEYVSEAGFNYFPTAAMSRAEVAELLYRALTVQHNTDLEVYSTFSFPNDLELSYDLNATGGRYYVGGDLDALQFLPPVDWERIRIKTGQDTSYYQVMIDGGFHTFMAVTRPVRVDRGGGWSDVAYEITTENAADFCDTLPVASYESCDISASSTGLTQVALLNMDWPFEFGDLPENRTYIFAHPSEDHVSVVVTDRFLIEAGVADAAELVREIADSVRF